MQHDVLEFGETESKEAAQTLIIQPASQPATLASLPPCIWEEYCLDRKSLGKNAEIRSEPKNSVGSFYLDRYLKLQLDVLGMKQRFIERRIWGNKVIGWNMKLCSGKLTF